MVAFKRYSYPLIFFKTEVTYRNFSTMYNPHPWRPRFVGSPVCQVIEVCLDAAVCEGFSECPSGAGEAAVPRHLIQGISIGCLVSTVCWAVQAHDTILKAKRYGGMRVVPHISPKAEGGTQGSRAVYVVLPEKKHCDDFITRPPLKGPKKPRNVMTNS